MLTLALLISILALFSGLAFWKPNAVMFMVTGAMSMMSGLNAPDMISSTTSTSSTDITLALSLVAYSFFCLAMAFRVMFWDGGAEADED